MTLQVNRMHYPVTVLGHGVRAGIWLQGCTIGCAGCASVDTWDPEAGTPTDPTAIIRWLDSIDGPVDGITISGGEPFQQPAALAELLAALHDWRGDNPVDLLVFSGYAMARLRRNFADALSRCDAVVAGPYVQARNTGTALRGSDNQEIVPLTTLGKQRYDNVDTAPTMQVTIDGDTVRLIGIPREGDLERIRSGLTARGVAMESVTWLT